MSGRPPHQRDIDVLDRVDALPREPFLGQVWRVVRDGRDPLQGAPSLSRWCNNRFDALYASLDRATAVAEIFALLSLQPVFPSKVVFRAHRLSIRLSRCLRFADLASLAPFGIDAARYRERHYDKTRQIADAAQFLDFQAIIGPSARREGLNLILFTAKTATGDVTLAESEDRPIDWTAFRAGPRG